MPCLTSTKRDSIKKILGKKDGKGGKPLTSIKVDAPKFMPLKNRPTSMPAKKIAKGKGDIISDSGKKLTPVTKFGPGEDAMEAWKNLKNLLKNTGGFLRRKINDKILRKIIPGRTVNVK